MAALVAVAGLPLALLFAPGCDTRTPAQTTLGSGAPPPGVATSVRDLRPATSARVTASGTMTEKCPVAGCWFKLRDKTGVVKVDTKNAGFVVSDIPLGTIVTVSGAVVTVGGERQIAATGLRY